MEKIRIEDILIPEGQEIVHLNTEFGIRQAKILRQRKDGSYVYEIVNPEKGTTIKGVIDSGDKRII